jgi:adenosylmethionine-8-amino-7-oxononanoate aminotransferase
VSLAEELLELSGFSERGRVFYSDNGSTAVEVALKICNQFWSNRGERRENLLSFGGGYHGDTVGAMSAGAKSGFFEAFRSWFFKSECVDVPHTWWGHSAEEEEERSLDSFAEVLRKRSSDFCAFIAEPLVQGASGMRFHRPEFLRRVCEMVRGAGIPVIFDEVMTGFYRTGPPFAFNQSGFVPDLLCLSKGLTGGILPLGVTIAAQSLFDAFLGETFSSALAHGHSFTGNPISCAAALASLRLLQSTGARQRVERISEMLSGGLTTLLESGYRIEKARVLGGIAAFEIKSASGDYSAAAGRPLARYAQEHGVILRPLGNVVYFMPPYCVSDADVHLAFEVVQTYLRQKGE